MLSVDKEFHDLQDTSPTVVSVPHHSQEKGQRLSGKSIEMYYLSLSLSLLRESTENIPVIRVSTGVLKIDGEFPGWKIMIV